MERTREHVRKSYAGAAERFRGAQGPSCCDEAGGCGGEAAFGSSLYAAGELPHEILETSLGCGNPTAVAELKEGDVVLDLGSGGGTDVLLAAKRVGPTGRVYGLDMTGEMLSLAAENQMKAGIDNAEFIEGYIEDIPLPAMTVDVVISNCVINLSADKQRVFEEIHRVLKPEGRLGISDVVADNGLTAEDRMARGSYTGCIAGALSFEEYEEGLRRVGFERISLAPTHPVADGMQSAIIKAVKPRLLLDQGGA